MTKLRKAIFPVAGLGTRFLPATKVIPKEVLTLVDRPLIQYAIEEARAAGIDEFIFVTARGKSALEDYFDRSPELERSLREKGKDDLLEALKASEMPSGAIAYVRQQEALGLGHAVWCARRLVGDEPFVVMLPDDVIAAEKPCLQQMVEAYNEQPGNYVAVMGVPRELTKNYGVFDLDPWDGPCARAKAMVEKPDPKDAPSNYAVIGRYILRPNVMDELRKLKTGAGGEIQLTDAIADRIKAGDDVFGYRFSGRRFDCGSKVGYLQATVAFGLERDDLREDFAEYLAEYMGFMNAAE